MIQIVKHIVSRLTEVYDRRAFRRAEILGCFHLPLRGSHHQCVNLMRLLGTKINNEALAKTQLSV